MPRDNGSAAPIEPSGPYVRFAEERPRRMPRLAPKTLRLHYRYELDNGAARANATVAGSLYRMATKERVPAAAIWWTKARMGWRGSGDPSDDMPLQVDFRWAGAPEPPPVIDAEGEDAAGSVVVWAGED